MLKNLIDIGLGVANVLSIAENHTEAKTPEEKKAQRERRKNLSDARNIAYLIRRFVR
jgi:hypothetical protein